ncbi:MAG: OadG family protein [Pyrinomonadaceae bacterium]
MKKPFLFLVILSLVLAVSAQTKNKKNIRPAKKDSAPIVAAPAETPEPQTAEPENLPQKKNARSVESQSKTPVEDNSKIEDAKIYYRYEFSQPNFLIKKMIIEHDQAGRGKITFEEKDFNEPVTDKVQLSPVSLEKIKKLFDVLNFLDSTENYQSTIRNYPHLGTNKILFKNDSKERNVEFNWTENANSKALADEYEKIGYQSVWESDVKVARENQPLQTPGLVDVLDSYLQRNEISDTPQMLPFLKELSNDERLPLIARNHILRLIKNIEKKAASEKQK